MPKTVKDCLIETFEDLTEEQFKRFKSKLIDRKGEPRIGKGIVQNMDRLDLIDKLVSTFTEKNAGQVTVNILRSANFTQEADDLQESLGIVSFSSGQTGESQPTYGPSSISIVNEKHFLDVHRTTLIERVNNVNSILDRLQDKGILNSVSYSDISTLPNDHNKMRALYDGPLKSCGNKGKDDLLSILQELQPYLMDELMKK
ncbi:apoptosis-associated speck-like protein containing a CARD isoform X1 [Brienomyrus brachyistius]|uniref:apoptosis-associated speck-like protein containing a CARD isoform X1 n=1 Tax=Brienomyrus brachyistius TaxID=42636 RepID=UPI0020B3952E|nr:apoptosis-associated speck-like protein containing a CARD isoform X1 [Brienomyrus brachyistius]